MISAASSAATRRSEPNTSAGPGAALTLSVICDPERAGALAEVLFAETSTLGLRMSRWERGSFLEGTAFEGHALGKPKIDRVQVKFVGDENVVLTNILLALAHML